jgi:hypothetical protein
MEPLTAERRHALSKVGALQCEAEKLQTELTELMEMYEEFENHINYLKEHNTGEAEKLQTELMEMYEEFEYHINYMKEHNTGALDAKKIGKMVWKKKIRIAIGMVGLVGSSAFLAVGDLPSVVGIVCSVMELGTVVGSVCKEVKKWKKEHRVCKGDWYLANEKYHLNQRF